MTKIKWKPKVDPTFASADTAVSRLIDWLYLTTRVQYIYCFSLLPWSQQKTVHPRRVAPYTPKRNLARDAEISVKVTHISIFFAFHFWSYFARAKKMYARIEWNTKRENDFCAVKSVWVTNKVAHCSRVKVSGEHTASIESFSWMCTNAFDVGPMLIATHFHYYHVFHEYASDKDDSKTKWNERYELL